MARVAKRYIDFEHLAILIVGDRKVIEPKLKETPYAPVVRVLDTEDNPQANVTGLNGEPRKSDSSPRTTLRSRGEHKVVPGSRPGDRKPL